MSLTETKRPETQLSKPRLTLMKPILPEKQVGLSGLLPVVKQVVESRPLTVVHNIMKQSQFGDVQPATLSVEQTMGQYTELVNQASNMTDPTKMGVEFVNMTESHRAMGRLIHKTQEDLIAKELSWYFKYQIKHGNYAVAGDCPMRIALLATNATLREEQEEKKGKEPGKPDWLFLTVSPDPNDPRATFELLVHATETFVRKRWAKWSIWAFEQRGTVAANDIGRGYHVHILTYMGKDKVLSEAKRETDRCFEHLAQPVAINKMFRTAKHGPRFMNYILGNKKDYYKMEKHFADMAWRQARKMQPFYVFSRGIDPLDPREFIRPDTDTVPLDGDDFPEDRFEDYENAQTDFSDINGVKVTRNEVSMFTSRQTIATQTRQATQTVPVVGAYPPSPAPTQVKLPPHIEEDIKTAAQPKLSKVEEEMIDAIDNEKPYNKAWDPVKYAELYFDDDVWNEFHSPNFPKRDHGTLYMLIDVDGNVEPAEDSAQFADATANGFVGFTL